MNHPDISNLLAEWPHQPGRLNVRLIRGEDGEPRLQMRVDLGVLQMHLTGRPDGERPDGYESALHAAKARLAAHRRSTGTSEDFSLTNGECRALREEAVQYYHRYISLLALEQFDGVVRDTRRNLEVLELCDRYAERDEDRAMLQQVRPYLLMMHARGKAGVALEEEDREAAIAAVDEALETIDEHFIGLGHPEGLENCREVNLLESMREDLHQQLPVDPEEELKQRLQSAVASENFELAAILRDELDIMQRDG